MTMALSAADNVILFDAYALKYAWGFFEKLSVPSKFRIFAYRKPKTRNENS